MKITRISIPEEHLDEESKENTPGRIQGFYREWKKDQDFNFTVFPTPVGYDQMIVVRDIDIDSLCAHHILPFHGKCHIGYVPEGRICGISKLARLAVKHAHKTQIQEKLTLDIIDELYKALEPKGAIVVIDAKHDCMRMRGCHQPNAVTTTCQFTGVFKEMHARQEFFEHLRRSL